VFCFESQEGKKKVREGSTYIALDTKHGDSAHSEKGVWQFQLAIGDCTNTFCIKLFLKDETMVIEIMKLNNETIPSNMVKLSAPQDDVKYVEGVCISMYPSSSTLSELWTESDADDASSLSLCGSHGALSWKSSADIDPAERIPALVLAPESEETVENEVALLGKIMERSRHLPGTSHYASNHIMVNKERTKRVTAPLVRLHELDELARRQAQRMADQSELFHSFPGEIQMNFHRPSRRFGENVARGVSIHDIHNEMMRNRADRNNILDRRFTNMGMGSARGLDGNLYLCQIFRG
jgi:hypothetical protein